MNNAIEVDNISKRFSVPRESHTLFKLLKGAFTRKSSYKDVWALKNITFQIERGDKVGVIGDNGSGKTTLFRIIAGLYKQTGGEVRINGEMSAFFNIGVGMQRDLTVLENIYILGAIAGFPRKEIKGKIDDILDFAELKDFIECPLKNLSIGMIQRLTIAIAKEVNSEVMIMDELLLGGDINFNKKCFEIFEGYKKSNKTFLISSHNLNIVEELCDKIVLLHKGAQIVYGPSKEVADIYRNRKF